MLRKMVANDKHRRKLCIWVLSLKILKKFILSRHAKKIGFIISMLNLHDI
jgi:hypothetical protein